MLFRSEKLPEKFKKEWLAALRSGDYKQGRGRLMTKIGIVTESEYCCMGVACKIYYKDFNVLDSGYPGYSDLPPAVIDCLRSDISDVRPGAVMSVMSYLSNMNDVMGRNFNDIADWIEENL